MQKIYPYLLTILFGYLVGCIHPSYILGRLIKHIDIRQHGSNNSGASNSTMVLGLKYGIITGVIDILKGFIAAHITYFYITKDPAFIYLAGASVIFGHMFPFYMGFRGGKGLATLLGFCFAIKPLLGVALCAVLLAVSLITNYIVLGTVSVVISFLVYTGITFGVLSFEFIAAALIGFMILYKHRLNYKQIINGTEPKVSAVLSKKK